MARESRASSANFSARVWRAIARDCSPLLKVSRPCRRQSADSVACGQRFLQGFRGAAQRQRPPGRGRRPAGSPRLSRSGPPARRRGPACPSDTAAEGAERPPVRGPARAPRASARARLGRRTWPLREYTKRARLYFACAAGRSRPTASPTPGRAQPTRMPAWWIAAPGLFVVADGMGGHNAGEVASALAVSTIAGAIGTSPGARSRDARGRRAARERPDPGSGLRERRTTPAWGPRCRRCSSRTATRALVNVGDSRVYLLRDGRLEQLTRDDSWVRQLLDDGVPLSDDDIQRHPMRHVLTEVVGVRPDLLPKRRRPRHQERRRAAAGQRRPARRVVRPTNCRRGCRRRRRPA